MPGGKQEAGELAINCMRREVEEECNLIVKSEVFLGYVDEIIHQHFLALMFVTWHWEGVPKAMEPHKTPEWKWFLPNALPLPREQTKLLQMCIQNGIFRQAYKLYHAGIFKEQTARLVPES
jgi:ADP-ribose pyrophosphatase YjhB (NUDIX family)